MSTSEIPTIVFIVCVLLLAVSAPVLYVKLRLSRRGRAVLLAQVDQLRAELSEKRTQVHQLSEQLAELRKKVDVEHLQRSLEEMGARNVELRRELEGVRLQLAQADYRVSYMRNFGDRFRHDSTGRLELLRDIFEQPDGTITPDAMTLAKEQLDFIEESLRLNLAPDISAHVKAAVTAGTESFNLTKRVTRLCDTFRQRDKEERITINIENKDIWLWGKWTHVELLISNLVSNALKHGSEKGPIEVNLRKVGNMAELVVENEGGPLSQDLIDGGASATDKPQYGTFFVRQVTDGYGGQFTLDNTTEVRGTGRNQRHTPRVRATVTLPVKALS